MKLHEMIEKSYQNFVDNAANARIILLHPRSRYRSILIARLVNAPDFNVYYYGLGPDDIKLSAFIYSITHDMAEQHPTFGRHINMLPQHVHEDMDTHFDVLLATFVRELEEISEEPFLLVLDEYDRSDRADDIQHFIEKLARSLPEHCRLVLNSRTLPRLPWISMIAGGSAILLEDDQIISERFYGTDLESEGLLEIFALGPGYVTVDGESIDQWEGHLPRLLFFFALDRPIVTRSDICRAFWPELDTDQAVNVFHVTKRRLHKALDMDVLVHDSGYYRVNPELDIYYDVLDFVTTLMQGRNEANPARLDAWQKAAMMYRGPFLQGHDDDWLLDRRVDFRAGYLEALSAIANDWLARDGKEQALALYQKAIAADFGREEIHRKIISLYAELGRRSEAIAHYRRVAEVIKKTQGAELAPDTQALYAEIMA
jgi:DNA-binding SARP family transcriptional activator